MDPYSGIRRLLSTVLSVAFLIAILAPSVARATPTQINVRIEGKSETLFEGPIWTEGHDVEASSDTQERPCDGTNNHQHTTPGPTPTAAAVDAVGILGETFDGQWYTGYDDYFITRWGQDAQDPADGAYWGILVNDVFTDVGGCQYELGTDDEVLWVYNAFESGPILALFPAGDGAARPPLTVTAELDKPFTVEVIAYADDEEDDPPVEPERSDAKPYEVADVSPVLTSTNGFEKVETESPETVTTNAEGKASITFTTPGWHRIKATTSTESGEDTFRTNRIDVCVPALGETGCGEPPAEDQTRTPPSVEEEIGYAMRRHHEEEPSESLPVAPVEVTRGPPAGTAPSEGGQPTGSASSTPVRLQTPALDGQGAVAGLIGVSWRILEPGVGLKSWTIASKTLGAKHASYVTRASGTTTTSALLKLPAGAAYELQMTVTDVLGRTATTPIGKLLVPKDDRWRGLRYRGDWQYIQQSSAWLGTITRGQAGVQVSMTLGAGHAVFMLRGTPHPARVEIRSGARRQVFALAAGATAASRKITAANRSHAGTVSLRVLSGTVDLDGVAVEP